jgi:hypothetical protein
LQYAWKSITVLNLDSEANVLIMNIKEHYSDCGLKASDQTKRYPSTYCASIGEFLALEVGVSTDNAGNLTPRGLYNRHSKKTIPLPLLLLTHFTMNQRKCNHSKENATSTYLLEISEITSTTSQNCM